MTSPKIVVIGSSNTDMVVKLDRLPKPGETLLGGEFTSYGGGKGANQAVAAVRAGGDVTFVARLGCDALGDQALAFYIKEGIDTRFIFRDPSAASGVALIFVGGHGENSIAVAPGANAQLSPADLEAARPVITGADAVLLQLEIPLETVRSAVAMAHEAGVPVILNPAPAQPLPDDLREQIDLLTPNESEAGALSGLGYQFVEGKRKASKAAEVLHRLGSKAVIVTMGENGALISEPERSQIIKSFKVEAVDTTAAGDTFNGALAVALAEKQPLPEAVRFAQAAAALSVTRSGAQESTPRREEIERFLREHCDKGGPGEA